MMEIAEFIVCCYLFCRAEVNAPKHNVWLTAWPDISLYGLLTVHVYGNVHNIATLHEAIGRCISPSPSEVYPDRRSSPYYLV